MPDAAAIAGAELFAGLAPHLIKELAAAAETRTLGRRELLFAQGDEADHLFVVEAGRLAVLTAGPDGRESMVAIMEPPDLLGELSLFDGLGRSASARALQRTTVAAIDYETVRALYDRQPELLWRVVELVAMRLRRTDAALADSVFLDVDARTAKRLLDLSRERDRFTLPITQEELAQLVGASRERVNKAIQRFVERGWIEHDSRAYRIVDRPELQRRAAPGTG